MTGSQSSASPSFVSRLRRDLGTLESYATLIGILVGAGIFRVTSEAWSLTGPSVILGYLILAPAVLATSVAYAVFLSTPLGLEPGGEYTHISRTFGNRRIAFVGAWLKIISYVGALAFLASAFADYLVPLISSAEVPASSAPVAAEPFLHSQTGRRTVALTSLFFFYLVHVFGVRWFGRVQVLMLALLGLSLIVLIGPGLLAVRLPNYTPFFTGGVAGFAACLPLLFFSYAGFESLAQTAGEMKDSRSRLPRVFIRGVLATTVIFIAMSVVTFGVLPGERLVGSTAPMSEVAAVYLPAAASAFVTLGALMALATSLNATMLVPSRLGVMLAEDRLAPAWIGAVNERTGAPVAGLTLTLSAAALLLLSGQISLALSIAVFALVILYFLHSLALLLLPRRNPELYASVRVRIPRRLQVLSAGFSLAAMGGLIGVQVHKSVKVLAATTLSQRIEEGSLTAVELAFGWSAIGFGIYLLSRWRGGGES